MTMTGTQPPDVAVFAGIGLAIEACAGIGHAVSLFTAARTAEETLGLAALPRLGADVTSATLILIGSAGLVVAAVLLVRRSRTSRWYALAVQGIVLGDVALRMGRGLVTTPTLLWGVAAVLLGGLLLAAPSRRWASVGLPPPAPRG